MHKEYNNKQSISHQLQYLQWNLPEYFFWHLPYLLWGIALHCNPSQHGYVSLQCSEPSVKQNSDSRFLRKFEIYNHAIWKFQILSISKI